MRTVLLLIGSNVFMTLAWYGHLKFKSTRLLVVIVASWLIALPEYMLQVPANRIGHGRLTAPQLKVLQEVISLGVFLVFSLMYLRERPNWRELAAMVLVVGAVVLAMSPRNHDSGSTHPAAAPEATPREAPRGAAPADRAGRTTISRLSSREAAEVGSQG